MPMVVGEGAAATFGLRSACLTVRMVSIAVSYLANASLVPLRRSAFSFNAVRPRLIDFVYLAITETYSISSSLSSSSHPVYSAVISAMWAWGEGEMEQRVSGS